MPTIVIALLVLLGVGAAAGGSGNVGKFIQAKKEKPATELPATSPTVTQVPTPALLPGLVAFGVSTLRKRRSLSDQAANEDANNS